jgi:hypothetical protein
MVEGVVQPPHVGEPPLCLFFVFYFLFFKILVFFYIYFVLFFKKKKHFLLVFNIFNFMKGIFVIGVY